MHILIAPNAFKNSLSASAVAAAIAKGLQQSKLHCTYDLFPMGDGGDGTAELIIQKHKGTVINTAVNDPLRRNINASFGLIDKGNCAVIELANASGIKLMKQDEQDPIHATTYGTGELIKHALDKGVNKIIMCIGGSATVDGGVGILEALGVRFLDNKMGILQNLPENLIDLASIDLCGIDKRIFSCQLIILCDVENTLLGENGAAKIFGPQKGASPEDIRRLEICLTQLQRITLNQTGIDMALIEHGGAAGGVAAAMYTFCKARLVNGADHFLTITGFEEALQKANIVITGEGSIDNQTLLGKGPYRVALKARGKNIPVIGIAGKVPLNANTGLQKYFNVLLPVNNEPCDLRQAVKNTKDNLVRTAEIIGDLLAMFQAG